jgi:hypothetical protein
MGEDDKKNRSASITGAKKAPEDRIAWLESQARTIRADLTEVSLGREEIGVTFGLGRPSLEKPGEITVDLLGRILLTPFMAKRFSLVLNEALERHESRYGPIGPDLTIGSGSTGTEMASRKKELLLRLIKGLHVEFGLERSFKVLPGVLLTNRFLLSLYKDAVSRERLLDLCQELGLPDHFREPLLRGLPDAKLLHFGFEENETGSIYKVYLEMSIKSRLYPFLLYQGFKWDSADPARGSLARYTCYPSFTPKDMVERISLAFHGTGSGEPFDIAKSIVGMAADITQEILYLDVAEDNNKRRSFDINMYKSGIALFALYPLLSRIRDHYSVPLPQFQALFESVKEKRFGHLSGGIDREGRSFFTVHFGVEMH